MKMNVKKIKIDLKHKLGLDILKENIAIIAIFIPHRGCKNCCVFCNQRKISGEMKDVTPSEVKNQIEMQLKSIAPQKKKQIAFFGGSFTGLEMQEQEAFLKVANEYIKKGDVSSIRISTRPDYITDEILMMLKKYNVEVIELGVQSMDDNCLKLSKRGHTSKDVISASKKIKKYGFVLGHQMMIGLPGSSMESEIKTITKLIKLKPRLIRIYPVYVLKQSELYDMWCEKKYIALSVEEAVKRTAEIYVRCIKAKLNIIRVGLQTTNEICEASTDIIGPVCDNYRERVLSLIAHDYVQKKLRRYKYKKINILVPKEQINYVVGANKSNMESYLKISSVKFIVNK